MSSSKISEPNPLRIHYDDFCASLAKMMSGLRHEADHASVGAQHVLDISGSFLAVLEQSYAESVSIHHKLERRIMGLD